jgi:hypothetical protein
LPNGERRPERWERADPDPTAVHMKDAPSPAAENGRFGLVKELASVRSLYRSPPDASDGHRRSRPHAGVSVLRRPSPENVASARRRFGRSRTTRSAHRGN